MIGCKNCSNLIDPKSRKVFCSRSCSASYSNRNRILSSETKNKIRNSIISARLEGRSKTPTEGIELNLITKTCISCGKNFDASKNERKKTCSIPCKKEAYELGLYNLKGKSGGYRKGGGRGKSGRYKGIWCDSSYELAWVIYHLDNGILFERNKQSFQYEYNGETHLYYPDFILKETNELVEIKGFFNDQTYAKIRSVVGINLMVIGKEEMKKYIEYAIDRYGKNFISLYDDNSITNSCKQCGNPCKKRCMYCSRNCAGKGNNRNSKL